MTPTNDKVDQSDADERISQVLAALSDSKHWHQGDKWRNSSDPQEKAAWQDHMNVIDAAIEALQAQTAQAVDAQGNKADYIGVMEDSGVRWFNKNPHAYSVGTHFYAVPQQAVAASELVDEKAHTGNAEADRIINRLSSSDPDFDDCADAVALIHKLVAEHKGPDGFSTWKDAAIDERAKRLASTNQPVQATPNMHDGAKLLTDSELSDPEYMRAYISGMHETIEDLKAARSIPVQAKALTDERAAFEQHYRPRLAAGDLVKNGNGDYAIRDIHERWVGWQARALLASQPSARPAEELAALKSKIIEYGKQRFRTGSAEKQNDYAIKNMMKSEQTFKEIESDLSALFASKPSAQADVAAVRDDAIYQIRLSGLLDPAAKWMDTTKQDYESSSATYRRVVYPASTAQPQDDGVNP